MRHQILNKLIVFFWIALLTLSCSKKEIVIIEEGSQIDTTGVPRVNLTNIEFRDGSIYLEWDPVIKKNFDRAYLFVNGYDIELSKEIINSQSYNDTYGLDYEINYKIWLENYTSFTESNVLELNIDNYTMDVEEELIDYNKLKVTYGQYPLYNNCKTFTLRNMHEELEVNPNGGEVVVESEFDYIFGETLPYVHSFEPRRINGSLGESIVKNYFIGESFEIQECRDFVFSENENALYGLRIEGGYTPFDVYVYKLNPQDLSIIESKFIATVNSRSYGKVVINHLTNNLFLDLINVSYSIDISTLTITEEWRAENFITDIDKSFTYYRNGVLVVNEYLDNKVSIFNLATNELIYSETSSDGNFFISDDGHYFYFNDTINSINNGIIDFIVTTDSNIPNHYVNSLEFIINDSKCVYSYQGGIPVIYNFNSGVKTELTGFIDIDQVQYDAVTESLMLGQYHQPECKSYIFLYDIPNSKIKKIRVKDDHYGRIYKYLNGTLIFSAGRYLKGYMDN